MNRWTLTMAAVAAALVPGSALAAPAERTARSMTDPAVYSEALGRLSRPPSAVVLPPLPVDATVALTRALTAHAASLGVPVHPNAVQQASRIPAPFAGRVAQLLDALVLCDASSSPTRRLDCASAANDALAAVLRTDAPAFADVDLWPSLYIDGNGGSNTYRYDYAVLIDRGGDDTYDNNAGGNLMDLKRGPTGSAAPSNAWAIGCELVQGNFPAPTGHDCVAAPQVAFLDYRRFGSSNDVYGVFKSPRTTDHNPPATGPRTVDGDCTTSSLIRRIALQGSGFAGNGLLMDVEGTDRYRGKTAAQGSGHVGGVGVLRDLGHDRDSYLAIRNAQGFALVDTLGFLQDDGGSDRYTTYMPAPKRAGAAFQEPGSGGVVDDTGLCDNMPRMVQGSALLGGLGVLYDHNGADLYVGAPYGTQPFQPQIEFFHSAQGFGCAGGVGVLRDTGHDDDSYREGPGRRDGQSVRQVETGCRPGVPGLSIFVDDGR